MTWFRLGLAIAVVLRIVTFWVVIQHPERAMSPDSPMYLELGRQFTQAYLHADVELRWASVLRTPGYPLFCHVWFSLFGDSLTSILIAQNILSLICIGVVFVLTRQLVDVAAARWAAVMVAMDPLAITYSNLIRNEVLFTILLVFGALQWHKSVARPHPASIVMTGLWFGLATLVRPVTTYLMLFTVPADMWLRRRRAAASIVTSVWMLVGFATPVAGWIARNHQVGGGAVVSSIEDYNLLYFRAAGAIAEERGHSRAAVARQLPRGAEPMAFVNGSVEPPDGDKAEALRLLAQHPYGAAVSVVRGSGRLLFGPGTTALNQLLFGRRTGLELLVSSVLAAYLAVLYVGLIAGIAVLMVQRRADLLVLLGAITVYIVLISSGPEAYSRFRAPLMPLFAIVAGCGFASLADFRPTSFRFSRR